MKKPLYYEAHITVRGLNNPGRYVAGTGWWYSTVDKDPDHPGTKCLVILTGRDTNYKTLNRQCNYILKDLKRTHTHVSRYKIEAAVTDTHWKKDKMK
jgi:hypothetical protein